MKNLVFTFFFLTSHLLFTQEVCNNGIDDDADGYIDLNDDECECEGITGFSNLIPNPSFEDTLCCPATFELSCTESWVQGNMWGSADFFHTCDDGLDFSEITPLPDGGNGFVGFGRIVENQELLATCLDSPLLAGTNYTLNLFIHYATGLYDLNFSVYGSPFCTDIPAATFGCPVGEGDWMLLEDNLMILPTDCTWVEITLTFTPPVNINALSFGVGCGWYASDGYYYIDAMGLTESLHLSDITKTGDWCDGDLELQVSIDTIGGTWQWYKEGIALVGETSETVDVNLYGLGIYTAQYSLGDECLQINEFVHEDSALDADFTFENACVGSTIDFENTSLIPEDGTPTWLWDFGDIETSTEENPSHDYATPGTYTVTLIGVNDLSCNDTTSYEITIYPLPEADIEFIAGGSSSQDGSTGGCITNSVQFNDLSTVIAPDEIVSWFWNFGDGETSELVNPEHTYESIGAYAVTLTVSSENGCTATTDITIIMTNGMDLTFIINEPTCYGFSDGSITVTVADPVGEITFIITDEIGTVLNIENSNTANTLSTGWYYITVEDESECAGIDSVFLNQPGELDVELTTLYPLCFGDSTAYIIVDTVFNSTGLYDQISYIWNPNPVGANGLGVDSLWMLNAGDYTLTINDENGCSRAFDFEINQPEELYFSEFGFDHAYCRLHNYQSGNGVIFGAAAGGTPDYSYIWTNLDNGDTEISTTWGGLNPGNYELTMTDANGCVLKQSLFLDSLNPEAAFTVNSAQLNTDCQGTADVQVAFTNNSINYANPNNPLANPTFFWNLDTPYAEWQISHDILETFDTTYGEKEETYYVDVCLVAMNKNGCTDTACKQLTIYPPIALENINIFSPNGDGINDEFTFGFKAVSIADFSCVIVNRWGVVVSEINDINEGWDGTNQGGNPCQNGVYFYIYEATTENNIILVGQGTIQLAF